MDLMIVVAARTASSATQVLDSMTAARARKEISVLQSLPQERNGPTADEKASVQSSEEVGLGLSKVLKKALKKALKKVFTQKSTQFTQKRTQKREFTQKSTQKSTHKSEFTQKRTKKRATSQKSELKKVYPLKKVNSRRAPKIE